MVPFPFKIVLFFMCLGFISFTLIADDSKTEKKDKIPINKLIKQLEDDDFDLRKESRKKLVSRPHETMTAISKVFEKADTTQQMLLMSIIQELHKNTQIKKEVKALLEKIAKSKSELASKASFLINHSFELKEMSFKRAPENNARNNWSYYQNPPGTRIVFTLKNTQFHFHDINAEGSQLKLTDAEGNDLFKSGKANDNNRNRFGSSRNQLNGFFIEDYSATAKSHKSISILAHSQTLPTKKSKYLRLQGSLILMKASEKKQKVEIKASQFKNNGKIKILDQEIVVRNYGSGSMNGNNYQSYLLSKPSMRIVSVGLKGAKDNENKVKMSEDNNRSQDIEIEIYSVVKDKDIIVFEVEPLEEFECFVNLKIGPGFDITQE